MPPDNAEACPQEFPIEQPNTNGKRVSHEAHDEQPAKRLAGDDRMVARPSLQPASHCLLQRFWVGVLLTLH